jgi:hypothetical protein
MASTRQPQSPSKERKILLGTTMIQKDQILEVSKLWPPRRQHTTPHIRCHSLAEKMIWLVGMLFAFLANPRYRYNVVHNADAHFPFLIAQWKAAIFGENQVDASVHSRGTTIYVDCILSEITANYPNRIRGDIDSPPRSAPAQIHEFINGRRELSCRGSKVPASLYLPIIN